jgi:hypothetical protein
MRYCVRVRHFEPSLLEIVAVVEQGTTDKQRAFWINDDTNAVGLHQNVAIRGTIDKIHLILQSRTTAADDCDSERALRATLSLQQLRELRSGTSGHLHQAFIPNLVLYFSRYRHSRIWNLRRLKANVRGNGSADRRVGVGTKITLQHGFDQSV